MTYTGDKLHHQDIAHVEFTPRRRKWNVRGIHYFYKYKVSIYQLQDLYIKKTELASMLQKEDKWWLCWKSLRKNLIDTNEEVSVKYFIMTNN